MIKKNLVKKVMVAVMLVIMMMACVGCGSKSTAKNSASDNNAKVPTELTTEAEVEATPEDVTDTFAESDVQLLKYLTAKIAMYTIDRNNNQEVTSDQISPKDKVDIFYSVMTLANFKDFDSLETLGYATETTYKSNNAYLMTADNLAKAISALYGTVVPDIYKSTYYKSGIDSDAKFVIDRIQPNAGAISSGDGYILCEKSGVCKMNYNEFHISKKGDQYIVYGNTSKDISNATNIYFCVTFEENAESPIAGLKITKSFVSRTSDKLDEYLATK